MGRFFETRHKCRECADPQGMLICALYVDLTTGAEAYVAESKESNEQMQGKLAS